MQKMLVFYVNMWKKIFFLLWINWHYRHMQYQKGVMYWSQQSCIGHKKWTNFNVCTVNQTSRLQCCYKTTVSAFEAVLKVACSRSRCMCLSIFDIHVCTQDILQVSSVHCASKELEVNHSSWALTERTVTNYQLKKMGIP